MTKKFDHLKIVSFGGKAGFLAEKCFPRLTSTLYLTYIRLISERSKRKYIDACLSAGKSPLMCVEVETINKCNGVCSFCPNNRRTDKRPAKVMREDVFRKIVTDLAARDYNGIFFFNGNNEPFLDKSICDRIDYVRKMLPRARLEIFTNGTLLTDAILDRIAGKLDLLLINNYCEDYTLNEGSKRAIAHYRANREKYGDMEVIVEYRYVRQLLTNRGGEAPNKKNSSRIYRSLCLVPFEESYIFADGVMGLCCNETRRLVEFGSVTENDIFDLFNSPRLQEIRRQLAQGRDHCEFCKYCDFESRGQRGVVWIRKFEDKLKQQKLS
ncbi:MAG: SPASM domain-containing protein [Clostridia bacterium]|nr:SPASM domain-containing protein [Clostridia bacterium]